MGCLILAVNPIYFSQSNTFLTDIPFLAFVLLSLYVYVRGLARDSVMLMVIGTVTACAAALIRQPGVLIPFAFAIGYLVKRGLSIGTIIRAAIPPAAAVLVLAGYSFWLEAAQRTPEVYGQQIKLFSDLFYEDPIRVPMRLAANSFRASLYLGLFLLPFLIVLLPSVWKNASARGRKVMGIGGLLLFVGTLGVTLGTGRLMPLCPSVVNRFGIGPPLLRDAVAIGGDAHLPAPQAPAAFWMVITFISCAGAALLFVHLCAAVTALFSRTREPAYPRWFLALAMAAALLYFGAIGVTGFVDRYLLPLFALGVVVFAAAAQPYARFRAGLVSVSAALVLAFGITTVATTHDYLLWNRVRWCAIHDLECTPGVECRDISGGFEYGGWRGGYDNYFYHSLETDPREYMIAFGEMDGYEEVRRYQFTRWLPGGKGQIRVLQAVDEW